MSATGALSLHCHSTLRQGNNLFTYCRSVPHAENEPTRNDEDKPQAGIVRANVCSGRVRSKEDDKGQVHSHEKREAVLVLLEKGGGNGQKRAQPQNDRVVRWLAPAQVTPAARRPSPTCAECRYVFSNMMKSNHDTIQMKIPDTKPMYITAHVNMRRTTANVYRSWGMVVPSTCARSA